MTYGVKESLNFSIGRVMVNLINNAFFAISEKKKLSDLEGFNNLQDLDTYGPVVSVSTMRNEDNLEIRIKDNGNGIPDYIKDKIFRPFFTTKPTGQGTGLGLSLSYNIIKLHDGRVEIESTDEAGTEFIILLPIV